ELVDYVPELLRQKRLGQVDGTERFHARNAFRHTLARDHEHGDLGCSRRAAPPLEHLVAAHARHADVEHHHVDRLRAEELEPLLTVRRLKHLAQRNTAHLERLEDHCAHHRAVIDQQYIDGHCASQVGAAAVRSSHHYSAAADVQTERAGHGATDVLPADEYPVLPEQLPCNQQVAPADLEVVALDIRARARAGDPHDQSLLAGTARVACAEESGQPAFHEHRG